jgi:hypothetical protein
MKQRDKMLSLISQLGSHEDAVCERYAQAEQDGEVERKRNENDLSPEQYARALWQDGIRKGWISK